MGIHEQEARSGRSYGHLIAESRTIGTAPVTIHHMALPAGQYVEPPAAHLTLSVVLGARGVCSRDFGAGRIRHKYRRGDIDLISPGVGVELVAEGPQTLITLEVPLAPMQPAVTELMPNFDGDFRRLHAAPFQEPLIERLCLRLWDNCAGAVPQATLFAEGAVLTLVAELARIAELKTPLRSTEIGGLSEGELARIVEFCEAHLSEDLSLGTLSGLIDMPTARFTRAFRAATGQTPHRFVVERRIARARALLAQGRIPLAEVAYACGFASQSHMTDVFRDRMGVTPGRYRKESVS